MLHRARATRTVIKLQTTHTIWTRQFVISRPAMTTPLKTTSTTAKLAICQICSTDDVQHNLSISKEIIRQAAAAGAKVSRVLI